MKLKAWVDVKHSNIETVFNDSIKANNLKKLVTILVAFRQQGVNFLMKVFALNLIR